MVARKGGEKLGLKLWQDKVEKTSIYMFSGYGRYVDVQLRVNYCFLSLNRLYKIVICMKILKSKKQSLPKILDDFGFDLRLKFLFGKATPHLEGTKTMWAGNDLAIRGRPFVGGWHLHQPVASVGELGLKVLYIYIYRYILRICA